MVKTRAKRTGANKRNTKNDTLIIIKTPENGGPAEQIADVKTSMIQHMCNKCNKKYTTSVGLKRHLKYCNDSKSDINLKIPETKTENHNDLNSRNLNLISETTRDSGIEETASTVHSQTSDDSHNSSINESATTQSTDKNPYEFEEELDEFQPGPSVREDPNICHCCGEDIAVAHKAGAYKCEVCVKYFKKKESFHQHNTKFHSTEKGAIQCSSCPVVCSDKAVLLEHESVHTLAFECEICHRKFSRKYNLSRHQQQMGCDPQKKKMKGFKCQACGNEFTRKDNLLNHLRMHLGKPPNYKEFTCEYCGNKYKGRAAYSIHVRIHTGETPFKCDYCPKAFRAKLALVKHQRRHTGEKPFSCEQCGRSFSAKETLNRHVLTHSETKPYTCAKCGMSFIQMTQLRAHMFHHTGEKTFSCKQCDMSFINNNRLTTHVKYEHEGAIKLKCPKCSKSFFRQDELTKHIAIHSDDKVFGCHDCGKKFKTKQLLICHTKTHRKEQPRTCPLCPRAFIRFDCLLRHFRSRHSEHYKTALKEAKKNKFERMRSKVPVQKDITIRKRMQTFGPEPISPFVLTHLKELSKDIEFKNLKSKIKQKTKQESKPSEVLIQFAEYDVTEDFEVEIVDIPLSESYLATSIQELLELLVERESFETYNWCNQSVDDILEGLIIKCGHTPADPSIVERAQRLRENAKILLTVVTDDAAIQALFETQTIDEIILSVLRLGKSKS